MTMPSLGQGTWHMADDARRRDTEIRALRVGLDLGLSLIDTAEMYADGPPKTYPDDLEHAPGER